MLASVTLLAFHPTLQPKIMECICITLLLIPYSVGQSDKALLVHVRALEQEKAMLLEQLQSAQLMLQKYLEPTAVQGSGDSKREDDDQLAHRQKVHCNTYVLRPFS